MCLSSFEIKVFEKFSGKHFKNCKVISTLVSLEITRKAMSN